MTHQSNIDHEAEIQAQVIMHIESYIDAESNGENVASWESCFAPLFLGGHFCAATSRDYTGYTNNFILSLMARAHGFTSNAWGTGNQWASMSTEDALVRVKQGDKAAASIIVPTFSENDLKLDGFVYRDVFNADQVEGYDHKSVEASGSNVVMCAEAESYLNNLDILFQNGGGGAYYKPSEDYIMLPPEAAFRATEYSSATEGYYGTKFHEYAHATGHETRCNRNLNCDKASDSYAFEELVAELSATILCSRFNISPQPREDHSKYIRSWLNRLKDDKAMIIRAMRKASAAISWMDKQQGDAHREQI